MDPANPTNTMNLVSNLALSGQREEARQLLDVALPDIRRTYGPTLAVHLARVGYMGEARSVFEEVAARRAAHRSSPPAAATVGKQPPELRAQTVAGGRMRPHRGQWKGPLPDPHREESMGSADMWLGIAVLRGLESERPAGQRILDDPVSLRLLPPFWRVLLRFLVLTRLHNAILARRERQFPGVIGSLLCRTRYIDDALRRALEQGAEQVVILGAGFDTRVHRVPGMDGVGAFEVDHPNVQATKRAALERASIRFPETLTFVPVDFDRDDLGSVLSEAGFRTAARTFFIWEGVTQYISRQAIENTLHFVGRAGAAGSRLVFTYIQKEVIHGKAATAAELAVMKQAERGGAPWRTGLDAAEIPALLERHGLQVEEEVGGEELRVRYLDPAGRRLATLPAERIVLAELRS